MKTIDNRINNFIKCCLHSRGAGIFVHLAMSLAILAAIYFYKKIDVGTLRAEWEKINGAALVITIVFSAAVHIFVGAHKLWRILSAMGVDITYGEVLKVRLGAGPIRLLAPLDAGELVNILYFCRHEKMPLGRASGAMVLDKGLNLIGITYWLLLGLILLPDVSSLQQIVLVAALGVSYIAFFFCVPLHNSFVRVATRLHPKVGRFTEGLLAPFREFAPVTKLYFLFYGVLFSLRPLVVCFLLFYMHGVRINAIQVLTGASIAIMAGHIPGTVVGMGPREWVISEVFSGVASTEVILSVAIMMTLTVHVIPMIVGVPWVLWFIKKTTLRNQASEHRKTTPKHQLKEQIGSGSNSTKVPYAQSIYPGPSIEDRSLQPELAISKIEARYPRKSPQYNSSKAFIEADVAE